MLAKAFFSLFNKKDEFIRRAIGNHGGGCDYLLQKTGERRMFPRLEDRIFISFRFGKDDVSFDATTKDISQEGLMFRTSNSIPEHAELEVEIYQPLNFNKDLFLSMPVNARVAWVKETKNKNEYLIGAKITKMNDKSKSRLNAYINGRLKF